MARPSLVRCRIAATIAETAIQTKTAFGTPNTRPAASVRMRSVAAVCGAKPVHDPDRKADRKANRDRPRPADRGRHHRGGGQRPRYRKIDLRDEDDEHRPRCDDAEERPDLQLLQKIGRRERRRAAEALPGVHRAGDEDRHDEEGRDEDRPVVARGLEDGGKRRHRKSSSVFLTRNTRKAPMLTAARRMIPSNNGWSSGAMSKTRKK